jgi:hypothetical protein
MPKLVSNLEICITNPIETAKRTRPEFRRWPQDSQQRDERTPHHNTAVQDRKRYKNLSIYITELPPTPKRFRDKYHRTRAPEPRQTHRAPQYTTAASSRGRPQTNQLSYEPQISLPNRPQTLGWIDVERNYLTIREGRMNTSTRSIVSALSNYGSSFQPLGGKH